MYNKRGVRLQESPNLLGYGVVILNSMRVLLMPNKVVDIFGLI